MNKQIEEMAKHCPFYEEGNCLLLDEDALECDMNCDMCTFVEALYNAGYRKQSEGEWYDGICTNCGHEALDYLDETPCGCTMRTYITKFCPNCGAKMKGDNR